jgi:hypothetical protein
MIKNCVVNVNIRICPTTFVLIPIPKSNTTTEKKGLLGHLSNLYDSMSSPRETLANMFQDRYYLALICEACRFHPEDQELWYLIDKPKEILGKILPLARAGLQVAYALNKVSVLGRIFGLPTPVLQDSTFTSGLNFIEKLDAGTLANYSELQRITEANFRNPRETTNESSVGPHDYCIREFSRFLAKVDPEKRWANLSARVNENGDLCYICPNCC